MDKTLQKWLLSRVVLFWWFVWRRLLLLLLLLVCLALAASTSGLRSRTVAICRCVLFLFAGYLTVLTRWSRTMTTSGTTSLL